MARNSNKAAEIAKVAIDVATQAYRFIGAKHYVNGVALNRGDVVELTARQFQNFGRAKFRPVTEDSIGSEEVLGETREVAESMIADARKQAEAILESARVTADDVVVGAKTEAENIVNDAKAKADQIVKDATEVAK